MTNVGSRYDLLKRIEVLELQSLNYYEALLAATSAIPGFDPEGHHTISSLILALQAEIERLNHVVGASVNVEEF